LQRSLYSLNAIIQDYNLETATKTSKVMTVYGRQPSRHAILMNEQRREQIQSFKFLGCELTH